MSDASSGRRLIRACEAICATSEPQDLLHLGISPEEAQRIGVVAGRVLEQRAAVVQVPSRVAASAPIQRLAGELIDILDIQAFDALIDISARLVRDPQERHGYHLWVNVILPRLRALQEEELSGIEAARRDAVRRCLVAYDGRWIVVDNILRRSDEGLLDSDGDDTVALDSLAGMIAQLTFLRLARGIRLSLDGEELSFFESWASECAGETVHLPE